MRISTPHPFLIFLFFTLSLPAVVSAQSDQATARFDELANQCESLLGVKLDDALKTARAALDLAHKSGDPSLKERAQLLMAKSWFANNKHV